jgi:hypothetical protein
METPRRVARGHALVLLFGVMLCACQAIFGEYKAGHRSPGATTSLGGSGARAGSSAMAGSTVLAGNAGSAGDTADASVPACDSDGTYHCTDAGLEVCQDQNWVPWLACEKDLCDAERGRCMSCAPGSYRCASWNLEVCASTGDGWTIAASCDTADYCDSVSKTCLACLPGETFCSGTRLYVCKSDKSGWDVTDCQDANLCNARVGSCRPCVTGEYQCNGSSLQTCDTNQAWVQADLCESPELCQASLALHASSPTSWNGKCQPPACNPGDYRCNPSNLAELQGCPPSGLDWNLVDTCLTPALCNPVAKQCDPGCVPGTYRCTGARLELCRPDGTGFDVIKTCQDANHCNLQQQDCVACVPGQSQCSSVSLQTCGSNLAWTTVQACASSALCDATNAQCQTPGCPKAGAFSCDGANLRVCPTDLVAWTVQATCVTAALCDAANGRCTPPVCNAPGAYRCQGNTREQCDDATRTWKTVNNCATGQVCDLTAASGCTGTCPAVATRCNSTGSQTDVEKCVVVNNLPQWQYVQSCATAALCVVSDAGATCSTPACAASQYRCSGRNLQQCNAGRTGWTTVTTCTTSQTCDATGAQCDNCTANAYSCSAANLRRCSADGQTTSTIENCGTAAHCYASSDRLTGYCYRCDAGNAQCVGTDQIQTCATDRRGWNTATACPNGCQDNTGSSDYCAACSLAGEVQCVQVTSPGSTRTCPANRQAWGATATCSQGYGCVDNGTADYCASLCSPNTTACVGTTGVHTCAPDGKGWDATVTQCADTSSLKTCVNGAFSGSTPCSTGTPYCVSGQCVACTGTTAECADATTARHCNTGSWVSTPCTGSTPVCAGGACVACTSASTPTCIGSSVRQYCSGNSWTTATCTGSTPYCQNGNCVACTASSTPTCVDTKTVQSCAGTSWTQTTCTAPNPSCYNGACRPCNDNTPPNCPDSATRRYCSGGAFATASCSVAGSGACLNGACVGCDPTSAAPKCSSTSTLSTCSSAGSWVDAPCSTATPVCAGTPGKCVQCAPDSAWVCKNSTTRHSCTNGALVDQPCPTGQICDPADATCKTPACAPSALRCSGNVLQQCNASQTGWDDVKTCAGTTPVCSAGNCVACTPNASECVGTTGVHTCAPDGSAWGATTSQCANGTSLATCVSGAFTSTGQACSTSAPACFQGKCVPCAPNSTECVSPTSLHACSPDGTAWGPTTSQCADHWSLSSCANGAFSGSSSCPSGVPICTATGSTAACTNAACAVGQTQCSGNVQQVCNADRTGWTDVTTCAGTTPVCLAASGVCGCSRSADCNGTPATPVCTGGQCVAATCAQGQYQCNGNTLQICNAARNGWDDVAPCTTSQLCDATGGTCKPAICAQGQYQCSGNALQICNAGRDGWDPVTTCNGNQVCDATGGTCQTAACAAGAYQCSSNVLETCNAGRTGWDIAATCDSTHVCDVTAAACLPIVCSANQQQCSGNALEVCNTNLTGWNSTPCASPTPVCDPSIPACVQCITSSDCSSPTPLCDPSIPACVQCITSSDCSLPTPNCTAGVCGP